MPRLVSTSTRRLPSTVVATPVVATLILATLILATLGSGRSSAGAQPATVVVPRAAAAQPWPEARATCAPGGAGGSAVACTFSNGRAGVTVSQTRNLINQTVSVAWTGLPQTQSASKGLEAVNGVAILQCWGADPTRDHCWPWNHYLGGFQDFSATDDPEETEPWIGYRRSAAAPPFTTADGKRYPKGIADAPDYSALAPNEVLGETAPDGTGTAKFEVRDRNQLRSLGCAAGKPCSLVVIPVINPLHDGGAAADYSDTNAYFGMQLSATNWNRRAVIPLDFAPQGAACPAANASLQITTSEVSENMVRRWQPRLCSVGVGGVAVAAAVTTLPDRSTRESIGNGLGDLAYVARPVPTTGVVYAPLAGAGVVIAFNLTNPDTGRPFTRLNISPRIMAKLLTQSYCGVVCGEGSYPGDPNVAHARRPLNPSDLARDPELLALNPQLVTGTGADRRSLVYGANPPEVSFSDSDIFYRLTQWINADPAARAWLDGKPDEFGMTVNRTFLRWALPLDGPVKRDDYVLPRPIPDCGVATCPYGGFNYLDLQNQFAPNMSTAASNVLQGWTSGTTVSRFDPLGNLTGFGRVDPSTLPGTSRFILGVVSSAQAGAYGLDTAAIPGPDGTYVTPTRAALSAAVAAATKDPRTGMWSVRPGAGGAKAYPLTLIEHAVAKNTGLTREVAAAGSAFVRYAATDGQVVGTDLGQLPAGYVPVTAQMDRQAVDAAAVIAAAATKPTTTPTPTPTPTIPGGTARPAPSIPAGTRSPSPTPTAGPASTPGTGTTPDGHPAQSGGGPGAGGGSGTTVGGTVTGGAGVVPDATAGGPSGTSGSASGSAGSAGSGGSGGSGSGVTRGTDGSGGTGAGSNTGSTGSTGSGVPSGAPGSGPPGGGAGPVPTAGPTPGVAPGAGVAVGVAPTTGAISNTAAQGAQPGATVAPPAGTLRWALLALLVLALAAGISAPLLAGTGRGAKVIASVRKTFTR